MKKISLLTITLLLFLTGSITASDTGSYNRVAFSDPSKQIRMPADWQDRPIKHDSAYADADLFSPDLSALREAGWKFKDTELVGEPSK
ncbi:MAG: hypothetical protein KAJ10_07655 [Thermodesulfovibrionia bacterium]|nr:hypothetical protein [Thermodesulfovibrionia bacterium]